ncbi:hypothetical protein [Hymenobacter crusticola]|uniref:NADP-dependent oxidoreductase domain-containing protein n=1 Tax=Hymenobacter crusticola TaxID=1770526 RepID=A0A2C9ZU43_9BACT|nr:hypothetical protein [Hymenobacter crusticola]OUJ70466.1 hypothetical protein BXP70_24205 [Hymenobacter crusticola]
MQKRLARTGGNFIDASNAYQHGQAECLVGELMRADRGGFVLTPKYTRTDSPAAPIAQLVRTAT